MYVTVATLLAIQCTVCHTIRVPISWDNVNSEVNKHNQFAVEQFAPQNAASSNQKPIPKEYFQYTAQKPKFAVDIAKSHGVPSPQEHFKAYPIKPHTGVPKPELGKHLIQIPNKEKNIFTLHRELPKKNEPIRVVAPSSTSFEIFHPYKLEEPALKELYQDPVMEKIRGDIENNRKRLQKYEIEAGEPNITRDEYSESPEEIDRKKVPHKNSPAAYEIHRPQRRPVYYKPFPVHNQREQVLNQKLRHPWQQNHIKVSPAHYRPVKNHLQRLRQQHALKYDDERNEYPQLPIPEKQNEPPEGYDIYEKGKAKFENLRNDVDESLNTVIQKNRPSEIQKFELNDADDEEDTEIDEEDEFVPIKNYAQVRKTETTKHLPKEAAYHDADTLEEIENAPRLREAIKSSKAQTVYSEEGYEDSAYDHAGEQKHASDHEEHKGSLKQKEKSNGRFKLPSLNNKYEDEGGSEYRDKVEDGKKWKDTKENTDKESELEEYSLNEQENLDENNNYTSNYHENKKDEANDKPNYESAEEEIRRIKREPTNENSSTTANSSNSSEKNNLKHEEDIFKIDVPEINLNTREPNRTLQREKNAQIVNNKYPYYNNKFKGINKDSPLRYAENLKFIPNKSEGGTEFYDSRAKIQCPEVEDNIDPIPKKLKKDGHPDEVEDSEYDDSEGSDEEENKSDSGELNQKSRLHGLGDKIDCFKAKYFGENPLDSPFFKEEVISNPEPVLIPSIDVYRLKKAKHQSGKINKERSVLLHSNNIPKTHDDLKKNQDTKKLHTTRRRRAAPFVYEPYKIIRDSQIQDSKKTTTTNNISPLIKQLQSSRVVDKVPSMNAVKDQIVKRSAGTRAYKDIGRSERENNVQLKGSEPLFDASFVDVNIDNRRGEPRYELRSANHKRDHTSVENKRSVDQTKTYQQEDKSSNKRKPNRRRRPTTTTTTTVRPYFDVSKFLPQEELPKSDLVISRNDMQSNQPIISQSDKVAKTNERKEEHTKGDDVKEYVFITSTTSKTPSRKKVIDNPTKVKTETEDDISLTDLPKLRLVTRFQNSYETERPVTSKNIEMPTHTHENNEKIKTVPKYRAKKKKITKSTLVTDTNSYGEDGDDDISKEGEVDALIGVKRDIEEYLPSYEIEANKKDISSDIRSDHQEDEDEYEGDEDHKYDDDDDEGTEEENEDNDEENDDQNDNKNNDKNDDSDEDEDDKDDEDVDDDEEETEIENLNLEASTSVPTKKTLTKTTEIPITTTEARSAKLKIEPVVVKKLDIHKELPVNRSSPHISEFKQDIKEIEIIEETPSRKKNKPQKNIEALELYKDENLAKDINKLGGVEVFKEDLDLVNGPKHGGNYRIAEELTTHNTPASSSLRHSKETSSIGDVIASPSKTSKIIESKDDSYSRRRNDIQRARNNRNRSARLIELSDVADKTTSRPMHGGNFRSIHDLRRRGGSRNSKLVELIDQPTRDDSNNKHESNSRSYGSRGGGRHQMHGGNYRSAKLIKADDKATETPKKGSLTDERQTSAALLNSFARAVSVLPSPAPYILDPSKRMYYFVEA